MVRARTRCMTKTAWACSFICLPAAACRASGNSPISLANWWPSRPQTLQCGTRRF